MNFQTSGGSRTINFTDSPGSPVCRHFCPLVLIDERGSPSTHGGRAMGWLRIRTGRRKTGVAELVATERFQQFDALQLLGGFAPTRTSHKTHWHNATSRAGFCLFRVTSHVATGRQITGNQTQLPSRRNSATEPESNRPLRIEYWLCRSRTQ